jgi:hypothetical protein
MPEPEWALERAGCEDRAPWRSEASRWDRGRWGVSRGDAGMEGAGKGNLLLKKGNVRHAETIALCYRSAVARPATNVHGYGDPGT